MPLFRFENTQACSRLGNRHALVVDERCLHHHVAIRPLDDPRAGRDWSDRGGYVAGLLCSPRLAADRGYLGRTRVIMAYEPPLL